MSLLGDKIWEATEEDGFLLGLRNEGLKELFCGEVKEKDERMGLGCIGEGTLGGEGNRGGAIREKQKGVGVIGEGRGFPAIGQEKGFGGIGEGRGLVLGDIESGRWYGASRLESFGAIGQEKSFGFIGKEMKSGLWQLEQGSALGSGWTDWRPREPQQLHYQGSLNVGMELPGSSAAFYNDDHLKYGGWQSWDQPMARTTPIAENRKEFGAAGGSFEEIGVAKKRFEANKEESNSGLVWQFGDKSVEQLDSALNDWHLQEPPAISYQGSASVSMGIESPGTSLRFNMQNGQNHYGWNSRPFNQKMFQASESIAKRNYSTRASNKALTKCVNMSRKMERDLAEVNRADMQDFVERYGYGTVDEPPKFKSHRTGKYRIPFNF